MPSASSPFKVNTTKITFFFSQYFVIRIFEATKALNFENSFMLSCSILITKVLLRQAFPMATLEPDRNFTLAKKHPVVASPKERLGVLTHQ